MDEEEYQRMVRVKEQAEEALLRIPGVHGVGIGYKRVAGEQVPRLAIVVHLTKKRPLNEVIPSEVVPSQINGITTDVIEHAPLSHQEGPSEAAQPLPPDPDPVKYRPLTMGGQIRGVDMFMTSPCWGTLGAFVEDARGEQRFLLSCAHVFPANGGWKGYPLIYVCQPDNSSKKNIVASLDGMSVENETVDAQLAPLDSGVAISTSIPGIGQLAGSYTMTVADLQWPKSWVKKHGSTTRFTDGLLDNLNYSGVTGDGQKFKDLLGIKPLLSPPWTLPGDSGSAVLNSANLMVGLHQLGQDDGSYGGACPVAKVFAALNNVELIIVRPREEPRSGILSLKDLEAQVTPELEQSATGRLLLAFYRQHAKHLSDLVSRHETVAAAWEANGGSKLLTRLYNAMQDRSSTLPTMLGEVPVPVALENIAQALTAAGNPDLAEGLEQIRPVVMDALGKSWPETLATFGEGGDEA